jgi:hypothetical protein
MSENKETLSEEANKLLQAIKENGGSGSSYTFRQKLSINEEQYSRAKSELQSKNKVAFYKCYGGGIRIIEQKELKVPNEKDLERSLEAAQKKEKSATKDFLRERGEIDLYEHVARWASETAGYPTIMLS